MGAVASGTTETEFPVIPKTGSFPNPTLWDHICKALPDFLRRQRWCGVSPHTVQVKGCIPLGKAFLAIITVQADKECVTYSLPLMTSQWATPATGIAWLEEPSGRRLLYDAGKDPSFWHLLFRYWQQEASTPSESGQVTASMEKEVIPATARKVDVYQGEQSNALAFVDNRFCVKLYRRLEPGPSAETEMLEYLHTAGFAYVPRLYGQLTVSLQNEVFVASTILEALSIKKDGWTLALEYAQDFFRRTTSAASTNTPEENAGAMLALARKLGTRTAELHDTLYQAEIPMLRRQQGSPEDIATLVASIRLDIASTRQMVADHPCAPTPPMWDRGLARLHTIRPPSTWHKIRIHGDYHLGQIVLTPDDLYIIDFEGEPDRPANERRERDCALRDVAGMLRSLEYAALMGWQQHNPKNQADDGLWLARASQRAFVDSYFHHASACSSMYVAATWQPLLWAYLLQKALYEVHYERNHRPAWMWLPLDSLKRLLIQ